MSLGHVGEAAGVVPEQPIGVALLIRGEDVEIAVAIDVPPDRSDRPPRIANASGDGDVGESGSIVSEQAIWLIAKGGIPVQVAVAVIVDPGRLTADPTERDAKLRRDIGEPRTVAIVAVDPGPMRSGGKADVQVRIAVAVDIRPRVRLPA
jgi:hypothetical protein